ncbi:hypothetical protein [Clostridium butyricum]|uniref:hypothetical protein n=1 Tax=Clostridium butyricum TaxID=1492 RepID=UPI002ABE4AA0|nr:hypothetical protein [Clostridium butyricum]
MASFNKTIITNNGRSLIAKVISGDQIKFTKMVSSSRDYTSSDLSQLTDLSNVEQTIVISSIKKTSDSAVKITGIFSNKDLKTGYKFKTVGLYAIDPDLGEILYSVTTASSVDDMPANTGIGLSSITIGLVTDVSNSNNTSFEVSDVATVSALEFNEFKDDVNSQLNEKTNLSDVKIFTSLSDIGLSLDDMTTDFGANILKIIKAMGRNRKIVLYPYQDETNTNLYNSVKTWCEVNTDAYTLVIESSFNGAENLPNKIEVYPNTNTGNNRYFVGFYDNAMGKCREVAGLDSSILLPLKSTLVEYEGVASGYSNKIIKKDNGIIIIHFCVKKSDGSGIKANELLFIADIPVGYRIKSTFGVASAWAGFKPSLPYLDSGNVLVCRVTEDCTAVVGNIIGEAI